MLSSSINPFKAIDIVRAAQAAEKSLISGVNVFDVYEGTGIPDGKKSIAIAVTLQRAKRHSRIRKSMLHQEKSLPKWQRKRRNASWLNQRA